MIDRKKVYTSRTYCFNDHPYAYATFTDLAPGQGLVQIHSDWGVFHSYWGAIGKDRTIEEFMLGCDVGYITHNFEYWLRFGNVKQTGFRLLYKFMLECWPKLREIIAEEWRKENCGVEDYPANDGGTSP